MSETQTPREFPPPAKFEHEPGTWAWRIACSENAKWNDGLNVYVSACGGDRWVCVDDGGDPVYLDEASVRGLALALLSAYEHAWPREPRPALVVERQA